MRNKTSLFLVILLCGSFCCYAQQRQRPINIIAYYAGDAKTVDEYPVEKLTHIIFSFCHLRGNKLAVDNKNDAVTIRHLVSLKKRNPSLKVILSLGGWSGCATCSDVFSTDAGRTEFAHSVKELCRHYKTDGIDIDWEYPAIEGYPGHRYTEEDRHNFTLLIQRMRQELGDQLEISFAAGAFTKFLQQSVEWREVMPLVDRVNLMTYDLTNGYSIVTGHQTPLYSTPEQLESADHAVRYLDSVGVPRSKMVIGAAFYARIFDVDVDAHNGLYQPGKFDHSVSYKQFDVSSLEQQGYRYYWDDTAQAPYLYNATARKIYTLDDPRSVALKTKYAIDGGLDGIMFWQLADDNKEHALLNAIYNAAHH